MQRKAGTLKLRALGACLESPGRGMSANVFDDISQAGPRLAGPAGPGAGAWARASTGTTQTVPISDRLSQLRPA